MRAIALADGGPALDTQLPVALYLHDVVLTRWFDLFAAQTWLVATSALAFIAASVSRVPCLRCSRCSLVEGGVHDVGYKTRRGGNLMTGFITGRTRAIRPLALTFIALCIASAALAHHGAAGFDLPMK